MVGSKECLEFAQQIFLEKLQVKPLKIYSHYNTFKIEYRSTKKAIPLILHFLYKDGDIALDRKMKLVKTLK